MKNITVLPVIDLDKIEKEIDKVLDSMLLIDSEGELETYKNRLSNLEKQIRIARKCNPMNKEDIGRMETKLYRIGNYLDYRKLSHIL